MIKGTRPHEIEPSALPCDDPEHPGPVPHKAPDIGEPVQSTTDPDEDPPQGGGSCGGG